MFKCFFKISISRIQYSRNTICFILSRLMQFGLLDENQFACSITTVDWSLIQKDIQNELTKAEWDAIRQFVEFNYYVLHEKGMIV